MPSQQVIEKLENLQTELETVSVAIKHIEDASKVANTAADILKKIPELLTELKSVEEKHRKDLQKDLKEKIDAIEKQLQALLADVKDKEKQLNDLINETEKFEKSISDYFTGIKNINFPERLDKIDNQISSINIGVGNLQTAIQSTHSSITELSNALKRRFLAFETTLKDESKKTRMELKFNRTILIIGFIVIVAILTYLSFKQ